MKQSIKLALEQMNASALVRGFRIEDEGTHLHVHCKVCAQGWSLKKDSRHPGNVLHLLNHEAGHWKRGEKA